MSMSEKAREARNAYRRAYYAKNKEREQQRQREYWERRAEREAKQGA